MTHSEKDILKFDNVTKSYPLPDNSKGRVMVFENITFGIEKGVSVAITGRSGSGKSTFLHVAAGLASPDSGTVLYKGEDIAAFSSQKTSKFRSTDVGFIFQANYLLTDFTALENVMLAAQAAGTSERKARTRAQELLSYVGLSDRLSHKPSELSGGEIQRVAMARAVMNKPSIIFADEPTGALDEENAAMVEQMLFSLVKEENLTLFLVSHDAVLSEKCDRRYLLSRRNLERLS
ncbi:ABC transporter ATP-binding protein [Parasphaerochaeta coccoides]|uniref:Phosphonate-transporting ATPase n=1 Tax=Parasphaerochaeta coccoides (strain ATCC BAA-1237 / DSM 17374 / SPN1) TaxID=760011 RepID=F4GJC9_PARC1|nr:ABC transporter ATP-binding protein [Parasphaerochaeta coccoides]AEC01769.1 Phosphonate-transporting ATPase [Parasphaerochaeta coccoides DSM 17374]